MQPGRKDPGPVEPPADLPEVGRGDWFTLPAGNPVTAYLAGEHWDRPERPASWHAARLSRAAYIYQEAATGWTVVAKHYAAKSKSSAAKYANREFDATQSAAQSGLIDGDVRAVRPLASWRGVLFLEYVDGLTLEDVIAVRRSRPGTLIPCLERSAQLLAVLHSCSACPGAQADFGRAVSSLRGVVDELGEHGVLENNPVIYGGLRELTARWAEYPQMQIFTPALIHGDATTSNFIFPWDGGVVAIDWERAKMADPAADLGRLMAEVSHSITQHGGSVTEAAPLVERLLGAYRQASPADWDAGTLIERARFYQALSTLRIARNGWVPRLDRMTLVAQAAILLANGSSNSRS